MEKLIEMIDFVSIKFLSNDDFCSAVLKYRDFLLKPIQASMFIECDENNNILFDSEWKQFEGIIDELQLILAKHKEARNRIYFPGFKFVKIENNEVTITHRETGLTIYIPLEPNTYQKIGSTLVRSGHNISEYAKRMFLPDYKI